MNDISQTERLDSFEDTKTMLGYRSRTSMYTAIKNDPDFPRPVYRGRNVFFFRSESLSYLEKLRVQRRVPASENSNQAAARMMAGKLAKRLAAEQRKAVRS